MTVRYVGPGGNDGNSGLSWAQRKLTLNGVEDTPVVAGDTVYVGPGTYRELLTCDVSGTAGNPIAYIGDYSGANTDGVGGVVRITGSADDEALTRANCIVAVGRSFRTFRGCFFDGASSTFVTCTSNPGNWIIEQCYFQCSAPAQVAVIFSGTGTTNTIQNCFAFWNGGNIAFNYTHSATVNNAAGLVQNCIVLGSTGAIGISRVGGVTVKNCHLFRGSSGILIQNALAAGQTTTVNNCLVYGQGTGFNATAVGEITEDFNNVIACSTARTNTTAGANSKVKLAMLDPRWFFETLYDGAGPNSMKQLLTPFDMMAGNPLIDVAGASPTATDLRGTGAIGAQREWGALEYDATLKFFGGIHKGRIQVGE